MPLTDSTLTAIPQEMRDAPRWGVWRSVTRDGRLTKVPYSPVTKRNARSNRIEDWTTFEAALAFCNESPLNQGLGFCLGDGWAGVDLDGCFDTDTGEVAPAAEELMALFNTYTEVSPSGTGFKMFMHGQLPGGSRGQRVRAPWAIPGEDHGDIEVYDSGRYFTVTGDAWEGYTELRNCTEALQELHQRFLAARAPNAPAKPQNGGSAAPTGDDEAILNMLLRSKSGARVQALLNGNWQGYYPSQSSADLALLNDLAWATHNNVAQMTRILTSSGLNREKWARDDYRAMTLEVATQGRTSFYDPNYNKSQNGSRATQEAPVAVLQDKPDFWASRPVLQRLFDFSLHRRAAPWGVLGCVLARVIASTPYNIVLPPLIGDVASLNLFVGLVSPSGAGKGTAEKVAALFLDTGNYMPFVQHRLGSGQGVAHAYAYRESVKDEKGKKTSETVLKRAASSVLFTLDEVDTLRGLAGQHASTLMPELRGLAMGERLGHMYVDQEKRIEVEAHTYRAALVIGIQPERADVLLDDVSGGTPQRFLWMPATYPDHPDDPPEDAPALAFHKVEPPFGTTGFYAMGVCETARRTIDEAHLARSRGEGDALDGHALLMREKVGAALAILDSRLDISEDDWELAGIVMDISSATRDVCRTAIAAKVEQKYEGYRLSRVKEHAAIEESEATRHFVKAQGEMVRFVQRLTPNGGATKAEMWRQVSSRHRAYTTIEELVADALARGLIAEEGERYVVKD